MLLVKSFIVSDQPLLLTTPILSAQYKVSVIVVLVLESNNLTDTFVLSIVFPVAIHFAKLSTSCDVLESGIKVLRVEAEAAVPDRTKIENVDNIKYFFISNLLGD